MKKIVLTIVLTVLGLLNVNAQEVEFGAKLGVNFSSVRGDNSSDLEPVTAFNIGVVSEIPISEKFSFQPELLYSGKGFSIGDDVVSLNYFDIPLMGKYYFTKGLSIEAGPQIGFLLSAKQENLKVKESYNAVDFGVNLGVGYKLENGINFGVRYNLGLSDINDIDDFTDKNKINVVQVSIGYNFF